MCLQKFPDISMKREVIDKMEGFSILCIAGENERRIEKAVAREFVLTIILNNREVATLLCSPADWTYLTAGFLSSEGLLKGLLNSRDEIKKILVDDQRGVVHVETSEAKEFIPDASPKRIIFSAGGRGATLYSAADTTSQKVESQIKISSDEVLALVKEFKQRSRTYLATHGVHSAALCGRENILVFSEDIGRHNALDKVFGRCLLKGIVTGDRVVITSGRVTSEITQKVAKRAIPIIISISAPTNLGVSIAESLGITLVCSVSGRSMDIYTNDWRITRR